jgi:DNA-directed RNA polymerase specialized sigma subunit
MAATKVARKKTVDPLDTALSSKEKLSAQRRADDLVLWQQWKQDPTQQNMHALMTRFEPVFRQKTQQWKAPNVNEAAFHTSLKVQAAKAFQSFDPNKAALRTHLENNLKRTMRFNAQQQNNAFIPEGQTQYIGALDRAKEHLFEQFGREPSHLEIATYVNSDADLLGSKKPMNARLVARIETNRRSDIFGSTLESDPTGSVTDRNRQILGLIPFELKEDEKQVFNHLYGTNGARKITSTTALAAQLGKSSSQISRIKSRIADVYKKHLG